MRYKQVFFLCAFVVATAAAPWPSSVPICADECPVTEYQKFKYETDKTYVYNYEGKSEIGLKDVEGAVTETKWKKKVLLSWLSPCEMAITFQGIEVDGGAHPDPAAIEFLTKYPLVVAITDGRVQRACSHPLDDPWAINLKKGVATMFQNMVPTLDSLSSGMNITETDITGRCPTEYKIEKEEDVILVEKTKDQRFCLDRHPTADGIPRLWMKAPAPIEESWVTCKQEIRNNFITRIDCKDEGIYRPYIGAYKYIKAVQESSLHFDSENSNAPQSLSTIRGEYDFSSLLYDHRPPHKEQDVVPLLEEQLKEICEKNKDIIEEDAAPRMAGIIQLLKRVPSSAITGTLSKIRAGQLCAQKKTLESLFLDAIAFTYDSNSVETMVNEFLKEENPERSALYSYSLYRIEHPDVRAVAKIKAIFEQDKREHSIHLSASTLVNNFCRHHPECHKVREVDAVLRILNNKIRNLCAPSDDDETNRKAFAAIEALGNIGIITPDISKTVLKCVETKGVDASIHIGAIRTFRNAKCQRDVTINLLNIAVDPKRDTETRIYAYLGAIRCVEKSDLGELISKISKEDNTQVRAFIFSHMLNIQKSTNPDKKHLQYLLTDFLIPNDYGQDFRKHSRNIDLSYYATTLGLGGDVEGNIIYSPGQLLLPQSVFFNFTSMFYGQQFRLGEFGTRLGGFNDFLVRTFAPDSVIDHESLTSLWDGISKVIKTRGGPIIKYVTRHIRERRSIDAESVAEMLKTIYGEGKLTVPEIEVFANIMGQDVFYKAFKGNFNDINLESLTSKFEEISSMLRDIQRNSVHAAQLSLDYALPTIHGVPIRLRFDGTMVYGLKMEGKLNLKEIISNPGNTENSLKIVPSLSVEGDGFVGYDCFLGKLGLQMNNSVSSNSGMSLSIKTAGSKMGEVQFDIPKKMNLLSVSSETYLFKQLRGAPEEVVTPPSVHDVRIKQKDCMNEWEPMLGLKLCYDVDVSNIFVSTGLPLGPKSIVKLNLDRTDPSLEGFRIKGALHSTREMKELAINLETEGLSNPKKTNVVMTYREAEDSYYLKAVAAGPDLKAGFWLTMENKEAEQVMETFAEYNTKQSSISQGFKIQVLPNYESSSTDILVFASKTRDFPATSKVFTFKLLTRRESDIMDVVTIMKTDNALRDLVALHFEAAVDLKMRSGFRLPMPKKLRRLEFNLESAGWKVFSYYRYEDDMRWTNHRSSHFQITRGTNDLFIYSGNHTYQGRNEADYSMENTLDFTLGASEFQVDQQFFYEPKKVGFKVKAVPKAVEDSHYLDTQIMWIESSDTQRSLFLLDIPAIGSPIKATTMLTPDSATVGSHQLQATLNYGRTTALDVRGPIVLIFSPENRKIDLKLQVRVLDSTPYKITAIVDFGKQIFASFRLDLQEEKLFLVEWKTSITAIGERQASFTFETAHLMEHRIEAIFKPDVFEMSHENVILPNSAQERRVAGSIQVHYNEKKTRFMLNWGGGRDPSKQAIVESQMVTNPSKPGHYFITSRISYAGSRNYASTLQIDADYLIHPTHGHNGFRFTLLNPEQKNLVLEVYVKNAYERSHSKINALFDLKTFQDHKYQILHNLDLSRSGTMGDYEVNTDLVIKFPEPKHSEFRVKIESSRDSSASSRKRKIAVQVFASVDSHPLAIKFTSDAETELYNGQLLMENPNHSRLLGWNIELHPRGRGVKVFEVSTDVTGIANMMTAIRKMLIQSGESSPAIAAFEYGRRSEYVWHYSTPAFHRHSFSMQTPSRRMQVEVGISPDTITAAVYPDRERTDVKYDFIARFSRAQEAVHSPVTYLWQGRLSHRDFPRDKTFIVELMVPAHALEGLRGSLKIDVLPDVEDKIVGSLTSEMITQDSLKVEADLSTRIFQANPNVKLTMAKTANTVDFDLTVQNTKTSPIAFLISGKYDHSSNFKNSVTFGLKTEGHSVIEMSAITTPEMDPSCHGMMVKASFMTSIFGGYDSRLKLCKPGYLEVSTNKNGSKQEYNLNVGLKLPEKAEIRLFTYNRDTRVTDNAVLVNAVLSSPSMFNLNFDYNNNELYMLMHSFDHHLAEVMISLDSWIQMVNDFLQEAARAKHIEFPSPALMEDWRVIKKECFSIYNEIKQNRLIPAYNELLNFLHRYEHPIQYVRTVLIKMSEINQEATAVMYSRIKDVISVFSDMYGTLGQEIRDFSLMMESGQVPDSIERIRQRIFNSLLYRFLESEFEEFGRGHPVMYKALLEVWSKQRRSLLFNLELLRLKLMSIKPVGEAIHWMHHENYEDYITDLVANLPIALALQDNILFTVTRAPFNVGIQIPLLEDAYSITQVLDKAKPYPSRVVANIVHWYDSYISIPIWRTFKLMDSLNVNQLTDYLPPLNGTALLVGNTEVLTYDGALFKIPKTNCVIRLLTHKNVKLDFQRLSHQQFPTITLTYGTVKATVKPDFTAYLNGKRVNKHASYMKLTVEETESNITLSTPVLRVFMPKKVTLVEVETSGWLLSKIAGVLGTFDDERSNDWLMPTGSLASNVQQFVTSWQEDHHCHTPEVEPVHVPVERLVECHNLLGLRSRCNTVVDPQTFLTMCRKTDSPCDAFNAYRRMCHRRGVFEPYPSAC